MGDDHFGGEGQDLSDTCNIDKNSSLTVIGRNCGESNGSLSISEHHLLKVDTCQVKDVSEISRESDEEKDDSDYASALEDFLDSPTHQDTELNQQPGCVDDDDDEPGGRQPFVQFVTEKHAEGSKKQSDEARGNEKSRQNIVVFGSRLSPNFEKGIHAFRMGEDMGVDATKKGIQ
ncbi:hypothetical protein AAG906_011174 [Vitis piasezkii]